jgi:hypothetical protein
VRLEGVKRSRFAAVLALSLCAATACVFWDTSDWSRHFGSSAPSAGPVVIAMGISTPWGIAADGTNVYFTSNVGNGQVFQCPASDCSNPITLASNLGTPSRIVVDSNNVYWTNSTDGTVDACKIGGCGGKPTTLATGQGSPIGIAVDGANVYWTVATNPGSISTCPVTGCPESGPTVLADAEKYPFGIAVDATGTYWVTTYGEVRFCQAGGCGAQPVTLASNQGNAQVIVVIDGGLYWSNESDEAQGGAVSHCSEAACSPSTIAAANNPMGIAIDGTGTYWVERVPNGSVSMCPPGGCGDAGPRVLATGQGTPFGIALDATYVYFTDSSSGEVVKVAKP